MKISILYYKNNNNLKKTSHMLDNRKIPDMYCNVF